LQPLDPYRVSLAQNSMRAESCAALRLSVPLWVPVPKVELPTAWLATANCVWFVMLYHSTRKFSRVVSVMCSGKLRTAAVYTYAIVIVGVLTDTDLARIDNKAYR